MKHPGEGGCSRSIWKCFVSGDLEKPRNLVSLVAVASASGMQVADLTIFENECLQVFTRVCSAKVQHLEKLHIYSFWPGRCTPEVKQFQGRQIHISAMRYSTEIHQF